MALSASSVRARARAAHAPRTHARTSAPAHTPLTAPARCASSPHPAEALTDPSYRGQILVLTYPMVGNYGVPDMSVLDEFGLSKFFESDAIHISALVVANYNACVARSRAQLRTRVPADALPARARLRSDHSHWNSHCSLGDWLKKFNVPAIHSVDTRALTKKLRDRGSVIAKLEFPGQPIAFEDPNLRNLVAEVSTKAVRVFNKGATPRIVAIDCGIKYNIIRFLARTGMELTVVRARAGEGAFA